MDHGYRVSSSFSWLSLAHDGFESCSLLQGSPAKGSVSSRRSEAEDDFFCSVRGNADLIISLSQSPWKDSDLNPLFLAYFVEQTEPKNTFPVSVKGMEDVNDFGEDFNILEFVVGQDIKNVKGTNILDDLEVERPKNSRGVQKLFKGLLQVGVYFVTWFSD